MKITSMKATRIDVAKDGTQSVVYEDREIIKAKATKPKGKSTPAPKRRKPKAA